MSWKEYMSEMRICLCVFALMFAVCFVAHGAIAAKSVRPYARPRQQESKAAAPVVRIYEQREQRTHDATRSQRHIGDVPVPQIGGGGLPLADPGMQDYLHDRLCVTGGITENGMVQVCTNDKER